MNEQALQAACCVLRKNEPLSRHTTFQLGGPCPLFIDCQAPDQLRAAVVELHRAGRDFVLIGGGSNLLVSDAGIPDVVVSYRDAEPHIRRTGDGVEVWGSTLFDDLAAFSVKEGLADLTFASGIPGTVGGAIAGNAGAFGRQVGDVVKDVTLLDRVGRLRTVPHEELGFAYRASRLQQSGETVVSARLQLPPTAVESLERQRAEYLFIRRQKHPDWHVLPTAGSFFKNIEPTSAAGRRQAAGWFLEQAGALQMRVHGARPFEKHANIIVRDGDCTSQDVLDLSLQMAAAVKRKFNLHLEREVRLLGRFR